VQLGPVGAGLFQGVLVPLPTALAATRLVGTLPAAFPLTTLPSAPPRLAPRGSVVRLAVTRRGLVTGLFGTRLLGKDRCGEHHAPEDSAKTTKDATIRARHDNPLLWMMG